jgi:PEP-CTERM motif
MRRYIKRSAVIAFVACSMGFAFQASALDITDPNYAGNINDGIPANPANEVDYINTLIDQLVSTSSPVGSETYNRSANPCTPNLGGCPDAELAGNTRNETGSNSVDVTGFEWLLGKYDAAQAGSYVWWVGDLTGMQTIPQNIGTCGDIGCGLSHWALYNSNEEIPVPEPAPLALLALGLIGLGLVRRRAQ